MSSSQSGPPVVEENVAIEHVRQPRFIGTVTNELYRLASYSPSDLPHLLYRVTSKESMGSSTEVGFQSALCKRRGQDQDLDFKKQDYQAMVGWFLNHKDNLKKGISPSPFISFSASLVTTLQRAEWLRKQNYKEIRVAVLETRRLNMGQLVIPMVEFLKAFNTSEERPYIAEDSMDEFLGWYRLDIETPVAEHITLVRNGLYKLAPELQQCADRVGGDLARLRSRLFGRSSSFVGRQFEFAMNLGDALYPGSIDTKIAFLCLRSHEKHGDELKNNMLEFLDSRIRYRYFDPHGLVNYSFARYYRWLDNVPSGAINPESKLYNPVHRQLMQEARKMEATIAAESTDRAKGLSYLSLIERLCIFLTHI